MKKGFLFAFVLATTFLCSFTYGDLPIGSSLPKTDYKMKDLNGKDITLKEVVKKNGLLVMFSCNTCPYVIKNQARTRDICAYAQKNNIGVVLVNSNELQRNGEDSYTAMKAYAKEQGYQWSYVVDQHSELADAFGAKRTPENFLFNNEGKLVYHGAIDDNPSDGNAVTRQHLKMAIDELLAGKEIAVKESRSVGCTIKRKG